MAIELDAQQRTEAIHSLKKYFAAEMDEDLSELRAKLLLDYILKEFGPLTYNLGVKDAEQFFRRHVEDLPATCFEPAFSYWQTKRMK